MNGDQHFMHRAIELARQGVGHVRPNPPVGAVVVRDGHIVGEGYHAHAGGLHAEPLALNDAGEKARGATLYVTFEPCNHHGRTPPCTEAIVKAGIQRVVYARPDPDPDVTGGGHDALVGFGIDVQGGLLADLAAPLTRPFEHAVRTGRPWVLAKFAASLDGRIATSSGDSQWITGPGARQYGHLLRGQHDAILVGAGTAVADDPRLTVRLNSESPTSVQFPNPLRVLLDSSGRVPLEARMFDTEHAPGTLVATTDRMPADHRSRLEDRGASVCVFAPTERGQVSLDPLLDHLGTLNLRSLLVEGGSEILGAFFDEGRVHEVAAFLAPLVIGGCDAAPAVGGHGANILQDAHRLDDPEVERLGGDLLVRGLLRSTSNRNERPSTHSLSLSTR